MAGLVNQYQQGAFTTPANGVVADATVVLSNDNATRGKYNSHDADGTIHVQSSTLASRPVAATAQRFWVTTDGLRAYLDSGSAWQELAYLSLAAGGTVAGATTFQNGVSITAGTLAAQALTATTVLVSSTLTLSAATSRIIPGATSLSLRNNANTADNLLITDAGGVTVRNGFNVTTGTSALQNLTATGATITGVVSVSPSAGATIALSVSANVGGNYAASVVNTRSAANAFGLFVQGGTATTDYAIRAVASAAGNADLFSVRGDGLTLANGIIRGADPTYGNTRLGGAQFILATNGEKIIPNAIGLLFITDTGGGGAGFVLGGGTNTTRKFFGDSGYTSTYNTAGGTNVAWNGTSYVVQNKGGASAGFTVWTMEHNTGL